MTHRLDFIVPGDPAQRTGGYLYDAHIVTEGEVVEKAKVDTATDAVERPARNASTEEWRAFANSLPAPLDVGADAGRDEIVAAYVASVAPNGNASKETW